MNTNMKALNMNELSINELETIAAGGMTRQERQEVLAPKDGDNVITTIGKNILRKVVNRVDDFTDLVEPMFGGNMDGNHGQDARNAAKNIFKGMWNTVKGWF